jgi:formyltetrahydrofolate synthetase
MTEIYFINDYYVETTSWNNAAKSWLKYSGGASDIAYKAIDAMDNVDDIFKMLDVFSADIIERAGIVKEYYYFADYYEVHEENFEL